MTIREYLKEYLSKSNNVPGTSIEVWEMTIQGKGSLRIEYSPETDKADIIHEGYNRRCDFYEADNTKDLSEIVIFCMGPVISDKQWKQLKEPEVLASDFDEEEYN